MPPPGDRPIELVLQDHVSEWMAMRGVAGAGIGEWEGRPCIKVFLSGPADELRERIPQTVEGYEVRFEETGEFRALRDSKN